MDRIVLRLAEKIHKAGGTAYFVGGCVRDELRGIENKDTDIEVHGITPEKLFSIIETEGTPLCYGRSFGIYSLKGHHNIDIALPRKERKSGPGHRDFEVDCDPFIGTYEASRRRDFTINAIMKNVLTGEITDHFGGLEDLRLGIIRHVDSDTFPDDPLRVLRAAQFAARFCFSVHPDTLILCSKIDISCLSRERTEGELKKALVSGSKPSLFFEVLKITGQLGVWFPEVASLSGIPQDPVYHPEGDVWTHTMQVLDRAAGYRDRASDPWAFMLLALVHDFGKIVSTEEIKGRIHAYGHEMAGLDLISSFLHRIVSEKKVRSYVMNMVPLHMRPNVSAASKPSVKSTNRMFDEACEPSDLVYFALSDRPVMSGDTPFSGDAEFLFSRLNIYNEYMSRPYVTGKDISEAGINPGEYYKSALEYAHKLRLAGVDRNSALKQVLSFLKKTENSDKKRV